MIEEKKLKRILINLPNSAGVYKMFDEGGTVIYIGKAKNLKSRVKQYFKKNYQHSTRTQKLLEKIADLQYTVVDSDLEARILELTLIQQLMPKYNVIMKDDKNYVYIKIHKEDFPRITIVRKIQKDHAKYYGPKTAAHKVEDTFKVLRKSFPYRHCGLDIKLIKENPKGDSEVKIEHKVLKYPCMYYFINNAKAHALVSAKKLITKTK